MSSVRATGRRMFRRLARLWSTVWPIAAGACLIVGGAALILALVVEIIKIVTHWR